MVCYTNYMTKATRLLPLLLLLTACRRPVASPTGAPVVPIKALTILVMGQSNAVYFTPTGEQGLREAIPTVRWKVVNCAVGATTIEQWAVGGNLYNACVQAAGAARVDLVFFYQGESNAFEGELHTDWQYKAVTLMNALKGRYRAPIVYAQLATTTLTATHPYWDDIKQQQAAVTLPGVSMIRTEDLPLRGDGIHLTPEADKEVGRRVAAAFLETLQH